MQIGLYGSHVVFFFTRVLKIIIFSFCFLCGLQENKMAPWKQFVRKERIKGFLQEREGHADLELKEIIRLVYDDIECILELGGNPQWGRIY